MEFPCFEECYLLFRTGIASLLDIPVPVSGRDFASVLVCVT